MRSRHDTGWLPEDVAAHILRIDLREQDGPVILHLTGGQVIVDRGDLISLHAPGGIDRDAVEEVAAAAARGGWTDVEVAGSAAFKTAAAGALAERAIRVANWPQAVAGFRKQSLALIPSRSLSTPVRSL